MDLNSEFESLRCRVIDAEEARTRTHREVLLTLAQTFDCEGAILLCEPSVVGGRSGPPDIAVLDPASGLHVFEIKGIALDQVRAVHAGGAIEVVYDSGVSRRDPSRQARQAMFDIKDAATRYFNGDLNIEFQSWVVFPRIGRSAWEDRFGGAVPERPDVLFTEDLGSSGLATRLRKKGSDRLAAFGLTECPGQQMRSVLAAFGDFEVLRPPPRPGPPPPEGSKGEHLDQALAEYRVLTELQQRLVSQEWNDGPRLVRGVAGSGKTVVLATQAARLIERLHKSTRDLFEDDAQPLPVLAVCFNRTLVPFIRQRIEVAYRQRTGEALPAKSLLVTHFNSLLYHLHQRGYCAYRHIADAPDASERAARYMADFDALVAEDAARLARGLFSAIFVDEGQDFHETEYALLLRLCARTASELPRLFVFYDDAQNLYGLKRPTWSDLGLDVRGRAVVMDECFRNTRQIIEPAFNLLLGSHAGGSRPVNTSSFADIATLREKQLVAIDDRHVRICFTARNGDPVSYRRFDDRNTEQLHLATVCEELLQRHGLLPQDILVLTFRRDRALELAGAIADRLGQQRVRCPFQNLEKDRLAIQPDRLTVSTVASAKGYDAPYVMLASLDDFTDEVEGRVSLYVGCTRAREWLAASWVETTDFVREFERSVIASG